MSEERDELINTGRKKRNKQKKPERERRVGRSSGRGMNVYVEGAEAPVNKYYLAVSRRFGTAQTLSIIVLVVFLVFMFIFYHDNITYANLLYLLRDLDSPIEVRVGTYSDIDFDSHYMSDVRLFKNGISLLGKNGYKYFGNTGSIEIDMDLPYKKPHLETGEKFALVADLGGTGYSIFSTLARVYSGTSELPIEDVVIGDSGNYAILSRGKNSRFIVTCYGSDFESKLKLFRDGYVTDIALSPDGKKIAVASIINESSNLSCEISFGKFGSEEDNKLFYDNLVPVWLSYSQDGTLVLICDKAVMGFKGETLSWSYTYDSETVSKFSLDGNILTLALSENALGNENRILCFDMKGKELATIPVGRKITAVASDGTEYAYIVGDGVATRLKIKTVNKEEEKYDITVYRILAPQGSLMLCGPSGTVSLFNEK